MKRDLVVVGAGPVGLAALWRARELGLDAVALERGRVCDAIRRYPEETVFHSTASMLELGGRRPETLDGERVGPAQVIGFFERLRAEGALEVLEQRPVEALRPLERGFEVLAGGEAIRSRGLILATGHYDGPRRLGVPGEDLAMVEHRLRPAREYQGQRVLIVGGSFSAQEAAELLLLAGAEVTLVHRGYGLVEGSRPERPQRLRAWAAQGRLSLRFQAQVLRFEPGRVLLSGPRGEEWLELDRVLLQLGYWADTRLAVQAGVDYGPDGVPGRREEDGAVPGVPGLYLVGAACNGERKGNRIGMKSGLPQACRAVEGLAQALRSLAP